MFRLSITRWILLAKAYANTIWVTACANSGAVRFGVGRVKWIPAFGSTAHNTLAMPHRFYSLSHLAILSGAAGNVGLT
jgi:hypothetical protein